MSDDKLKLDEVPEDEQPDDDSDPYGTDEPTGDNLPDDSDSDFEDDEDEEEDDDEIEEVTLPSLTFRVANGRIVDMVDGREAMLQAIDKIFKTPRDELDIYDEDYGNDIGDLIGLDFDYVKVEVRRMITEALEADDRVDEVDIDEITQIDNDSLYVHGMITTIFDEDIEIDQEVDLDG